MSTDYSVYPAKGLYFSNEDTKALLVLVLKRFAYDTEAAHAAWCRMLENHCTISNFHKLIADLGITENGK